MLTSQIGNNLDSRHSSFLRAQIETRAGLVWRGFLFAVTRPPLTLGANTAAQSPHGMVWKFSHCCCLLVVCYHHLVRIKKQTRQNITLARRCLRMIHTVRGRGAGGGQLAQAVAIHVKMACHEKMYGLYGASFRKAKRPLSVKFQPGPWHPYRHHTGWIHCGRSRDFHG